MKKRFFSLSLIAALFLMCPALVSCGDDNNNSVEQPVAPLSINLRINQAPAVDFTQTTDESVTIFKPVLSLNDNEASLKNYEVIFSDGSVIYADASGITSAADLKNVFISAFGADATGTKQLSAKVVATVMRNDEVAKSAPQALFIDVRLNAPAPVVAENVGRKDIMLQGFYWDSQKVTGWTQLMSKVSDISKNFSCVWLPPSAEGEGGNAVGGSNVGYHPRVWSNQNSCWGTADDLKSLNAKFHEAGVKVIADIVVNHRAGYTDWCNFSADDFGDFGSFQLTGEHICSGDETNSNHVKGEAYGAADTGQNWGGARDLDHTSQYVQQDVIAYLKWLKAEMGYDGWRYDFCLGFAAEYIKLYNDATEPYLSVGEYWLGGFDEVAPWIDANGMSSMAFDFPAKYAIFNNGLAQSNYSQMAWKDSEGVYRPAGLIHHSKYRPYSVTFVDNHDSYRDDNKYTGDVPMAYAALLSAPGIPCVFWPHWTGNTEAIDSQIAVRQLVGIGAESPCEVTSMGTYYESLTVGTEGSLICRIGKRASSEAPEGYVLACSGSGWYYFVSENLK